MTTQNAWRRAIAVRVFATSFLAALAAGSDCDDGVGFRFPDPNVRIIAFGDSTTAGPSSMQYVEYLPDLLSRSEIEFTNEGRGGETTADGLTRLRSLLDAKLFPNGETIIYWEGGNDIVDFIQDHDPLVFWSPNDPVYPFAADLQTLFDAIRANLLAVIDRSRTDGLNVVLVTYFLIPEQITECGASPLNILFPGQANVANAYTMRLNQLIRDVGTETGATVVDIETLDAMLRGDLANYENCNHLSAAGNRIAAEAIAAAL